MKLTFLLLYIIITISSFAQSSIDTTKWDFVVMGNDTILIKKPSKGDMFKEKGDLKNAINVYKEDLSDEMNLESLSAAYALDEQIDSAFKYLFIFLENDSSIFFATNPDYINLIRDDRWDSIVDVQIAKYQLSHEPIQNIELAKELWTMYMKDQAYYYHLDVARIDLEFKSPVVKALWSLKELLNEQNRKRLDEIVKENGWPKISEVGQYAATAAFLIVQHADYEYQKKYLPVIWDLADKGEVSWKALALLIDRVNMREGKPQIYGSQIRGDGSGNMQFYEILEPEYVNQRRKEIGLMPIEKYAEIMGVTWAIEQKEK